MKLNNYNIIMFIYHKYVLFVNIGIQYAKEVHSNSRCVMLTHIHIIISSHYPHRPCIYTLITLISN